MSSDRLLSERTDLRSGPRQDNLALRWESASGEGRILATGMEAVRLYQSDMVDGFRGVAGGFMTLGRIEDDGGFRPMIRQAIPLHAVITELVVLAGDAPVIEDGPLAVRGDALAFLGEGVPVEVGLLALAIDATVVGHGARDAELLV